MVSISPPYKKYLVETDSDTESGLVVARGEGGLGERGEAIKYKLAVTKQSWDVKDGIGNMVCKCCVNYVRCRWVLEILRGTLCKVYDCQTTML